MLTRWLVFHVASGQAFFTGVGCLIAAVGLSRGGMGPWARSCRNLLAGLGGVLVAASATPLPPWAHGLLGLVTAAWLVGEAARRRVPGGVVLALRSTVAVGWLAAGLAERPYHVAPTLPPMGDPILGIVGDSVTAGVDERGAITWPKVFAGRHGVDVRDHSAMGATVASAIRQARAIAPEEQLVLLEIGGNDLLGGTTAEAFEAGLEALLRATCRPGRGVVMLELPLPPGSNAFGRIQRRLARRHGAFLVPKRRMLGVLLGSGTTLDSIHLSGEGHDRMAAVIWDVLRPAYSGSRGGGGPPAPRPAARP